MEAAMIVYGLFAGLITVMLVVILIAAATTAIVRGVRRSRAHAKTDSPPGPS
jgi:hypothetical protein